MKIVFSKEKTASKSLISCENLRGMGVEGGGYYL